MPRLAAFPKGFLDDLLVHKTMSLPDWISLGSTLDVDGLEMYAGFFEGEGSPSVEQTWSEMQKHGLAMPMICFSPDFTIPDPQDRRHQLDRQRRAIDLTRALGGSLCRTLSGQNRPGLCRRTAIRWCVECIREAADYAGARGITLAMENHYKDGYWEYREFAMPSQIFLEIVSQIDSPAFGINFDPSNSLVAGEDPIQLLEQIKARVVSMHASDRYLEGGTLDDLRRTEQDPATGYAAVLQHGVIGRGLNDYDRIFSLLRRAGFDGWISIEDGIHGMHELHESAAFLRTKIAQHFPQPQSEFPNNAPL